VYGFLSCHVILKNKKNAWSFNTVCYEGDHVSVYTV